MQAGVEGDGEEAARGVSAPGPTMGVDTGRTRRFTLSVSKAQLSPPRGGCNLDANKCKLFAPFFQE